MIKEHTLAEEELLDHHSRMFHEEVDATYILHVLFCASRWLISGKRQHLTDLEKAVRACYRTVAPHVADRLHLLGLLLTRP